MVAWITTSLLKTMTIGYHMSELQISNESIERKLDAVQVASETSIREIIRNVNSPEGVYRALRNELEPNDKRVLGYYVAYEPNYFASQGKWFEPYVYRQNDTVKQMQVGSADHDYFNREWYKKALDAKKGYWSDPYLDEVATKMLMCSYTKPVIDRNGRKIGVFGADYSLDWLYKYMQKNDEKANEYNPLDQLINSEKINNTRAYNIIIDGEGKYIYHPDKNRILNDNFFKDIEQTPDGLRKQLAEGLAAKRKDYQEINIDGVDCYIFYTRVAHTNWANGVILPKSRMTIPIFIIGLLLLAFNGIGLIVANRIIRISIRRTTKPLHILAESADEIAKGNFEAPLPEMYLNDEIHHLRDSFVNMQQSLTQYIDQLKTTTTQKAAIESELSIARDIQLSSVPTDFPKRDDIDIYATLTPAKAVGGDLYDFFIRDNKLYFCIGDVSGKGIPAALFMMETKSLFRAYASDKLLPNHIVSRMNNVLSENNERSMFVTLFVGILNLQTGQLNYCNAGHEPPIIITRDAKLMNVHPIMPVGIMSDTPYQMQTTVLEHGSSVLFYTDGLNEAMDAADNLFGKERIYKEIQRAIEHDQTAPKDLINNMIEAVHNYVGKTEQSDDLTMLSIRFK
jgi:sigma-B regulation protein RsbU (phosphoserine phosphatase)